MINSIRAQLPKYAKSLFIPKRYKIFWGGRGAARSWSFARAILIRGSQVELRILCCREFQKSIDDSVHKLFSDQIGLLKLKGWIVQKKTIVHVGTGTSISFEGLRYNTNRIKSYEGIDICWIEEAESVTKDSWEILIPTIRKSGSEIWISFNPDLEDDPTYVRFVLGEPPNAIVEKVGWEDNPWFHLTEMVAEKDYLYRVDPETADHIWGGEPKKHAQAQVLRGKWVVESFQRPRNDLERKQMGLIGPFYGGDFGFTDATCCVELYIRKMPAPSQGVLLVSRESWKINLDIDHIYNRWIRDIGKYLSSRTIRADSSRPETISYLQRHGFRNMRSVYKWKGSVEDGVAFLRQFEQIIIHPDCKHWRQEARNYSFKVDKMTGVISNDLEDKDNHLMDASRYALTPLIRARKGLSSYSGHTYAGTS